MEDVLTQISRLKRPTLLVRTARHGIEDYNRLIHLRRLLKTDNLPSPGKAILKLMELETIVDEQRTSKRAEYSVARHVELIVALMCEARILKASKASRDRSMANAR
ncbi:DUF6477 family protein [Octadecabacter sp. G9-8]|uniref:DUF6477 family protein n=1 Tax=Octadecabacter dasysiphoniae TaxID=2909341 RepID=A0ABS9CU12_9RHOB|nr:DUF6477 family protein [Octadecabacter dasysiphoniae]MCF2870728.1 DUF6477 family protein [Octadecabacter dasysiphoniae]